MSNFVSLCSSHFNNRAVFALHILQLFLITTCCVNWFVSFCCRYVNWKRSILFWFKLKLVSQLKWALYCYYFCHNNHLISVYFDTGITTSDTIPNSWRWRKISCSNRNDTWNSYLIHTNRILFACTLQTYSIDRQTFSVSETLHVFINICVYQCTALTLPIYDVNDVNLIAPLTCFYTNFSQLDCFVGQNNFEYGTELSLN